MNTATVYLGDNLPILKNLQDESFDLIYIDPPFNTGKIQKLQRIKTIRDSDGDRIGYKGNLYRTVQIGSMQFNDKLDHFLEGLELRFSEAKRLLKPNGSFFLHIDYREVHYCKVLLDSIFGRDSFINEIIWAYDYGARSKSRWSAKHDNILWYAKDPKNYIYNYEEVERIPYMAPSLVGEEKAEKGKTLTDVWWHTIVPTNGKERTGYPTQKPLGILNRIIRVHSGKEGNILDFYAGSGTTGESALRNNRNVTLIDSNPEAIQIIIQRLAQWNPILHKEEVEDNSLM